jgi:hypothetical protein
MPTCPILFVHHQTELIHCVTHDSAVKLTVLSWQGCFWTNYPGQVIISSEVARVWCDPPRVRSYTSPGEYLLRQIAQSFWKEARLRACFPYVQPRTNGIPRTRHHPRGVTLRVPERVELDATVGKAMGLGLSNNRCKRGRVVCSRSRAFEGVVVVDSS